MASPELPYCTHRFCQIPLDVDDAALRATIPLEKDERVLYSSLSPVDDAFRPSSQIGTITWNTTPSSIARMGLKDSETKNIAAGLDLQGGDTGLYAAEGREGTIDSDFTGLTPLNPGSFKDGLAVDIVALTGVGGRPFMSWQHSSGAMWLRDFVPRDVPTAQVFIYGYPSKLMDSGSRAGLFDYTTVFLGELRRLISLRKNLAPRPLILVGHSFGGLIIKQAFIVAAANQNEYGRLFSSIYSIFFFGTPHRGLNTAALEEMVAKEPTRGLIEELKEGSSLIKSLNEDFSKYSQSIKIVTCYERLETGTMKRTGDVWKRNGPKEMMVTESSALLYIDNEERIPIYANHSMIAKLAESQGSGYHAIKEQLTNHCAVAPSAIRRRLLKQECAVALSEVSEAAEFMYSLVCKVKKETLKAIVFKEHMPREISFLQAFAEFLVDDELGAILDNQRLSANLPQQIANDLQKLKATFSSFTRLAMKFHEPYRKAVQHGSYVSTRDQERESPATGTSTVLSERIVQDPEVSDGLVSDDSLDAVLHSCRESTQGLRSCMSFATLSWLRFGTKVEMDVFLARNAFRDTDLAPTLRRQYLIQSASMRRPEPLQGRLANIPREEDNPDLLLMKLYRQGDKETDTVIVEYRKYEPEPRQGAGRTLAEGEIEHITYLKGVKTMMKSLAGLLHDLSREGNEDSNEEQISSRLNYFSCLGFLEDLEHFRYAFLFRIPAELSFESATTLRSLSFYISAQPRLQLEERFSLAYNICQAVLNLHQSGWVHKSIRSPNIILVPRNSGTAGDLSEGDLQRFIPYLKGFEFSRPKQGNSSRSARSDPITNLYRSPERQNDPTEGFNMEHDLYAVGVILLEIGMWQTVRTVFKGAMPEAGLLGATKARDRMKTMAKTLLPQRMGTKYAEVVQKCIGGFGIVVDDKDHTNLGLAFRQQVLDHLKAGLKL